MHLPPAARPPPGVFVDNLLPLAAIALAAIAILVGLELFGGRIEHRTSGAEGRAADVARIWGGPLQQPQPEVRWRRADAATAELVPGELARSQVSVDLDVSYRRRGLAEYPGYAATFAGVYEVKNPSDAEIFAAFSVGLPAARERLMLEDVALLVDGEERPAETRYEADRIVWTGRVPAGAAPVFTVRYEARGLERFGYRLVPEGAGRWEGDAAAARPITAFELTMRVKGARGELDFPVGSMAPSAALDEGGARVLHWKVERLLSSFDVGVVLPHSGDVSSALGRLVDKAPFFYLLYAFALLVALAGVPRRARALHVLGLSAAYFLYFPLAGYLIAYLPWPLAAALTLLALGALSVVHAARFASPTAALRVGVSQAFFLAVPAAAYLVPAHTGLILVVAGFLALAGGLLLLGGAAARVAAAARPPPVAPTAAVAEAP